jgi:hypothetical protein
LLKSSASNLGAIDVHPLIGDSESESYRAVIRGRCIAAAQDKGFVYMRAVPSFSRVPVFEVAAVLTSAGYQVNRYTYPLAGLNPYAGFAETGGVIGTLGGSLTSDSGSRLSEAYDDRAWFFKNPARVAAYVGRYVAVHRRHVVAAGTAVEVYLKARAAGIEAPLIFRVTTPSDPRTVEIGL